MKKVFFFVLVLAAVLALGCASAADKTTTLLVYMCGTDIQEDACVDLYEMSDVDSDENITIVVLAGGASAWDLDELAGNKMNLLVIQDGYLLDQDDWGRSAMGKADNLTKFLQYGVQNYPADRTIAILWDHGAGSEGGICFDETTNDDSLTIVEIDKALQNLQKAVPDYHFNIFGCDACMMGTYEMAAMLSNHPIDYFVASEELEPGLGWYYTGWLDELADDPSLTDEEICAAIIETFMEAGLADQPDDYLTLSAVKLANMGDLQASMEKFASVMSGQIEGDNFSAVRRGRSRLYTFGSFDDGSWDMVDLGAALNVYAQFDPENAAEAKKCLSKAVLYSSQTDNLDTCCGLSILIPQDTANEFDEYKDGFNLTNVIPNWVSFVNDYVTKLKGGNGGYQICSSGACQISTDLSFDEPFTSVYSWGGYGSIWGWDDDTETYEEYQEPEIEIGNTEQGFTATLSQEDLSYLDYVEGMLLMDISDDEVEAYVDLGLSRSNLINWQNGTVVSLFDGTWPTFGGQLVPIYDQSSNENSRRSLIPVKLNGSYTYLVVVFPAGSTEGRVIGANAGYDDNGLPIRTVTKLKNGDEIIPVYTMYYGDDMDEMEFDGDPITWKDGMTVTYEDISDEEEPMTLLFCFIFNDIFGEDNMSELISFEI